MRQKYAPFVQVETTTNYLKLSIPLVRRILLTTVVPWEVYHYASIMKKTSINVFYLCIWMIKRYNSAQYEEFRQRKLLRILSLAVIMPLKMCTIDMLIPIPNSVSFNWSHLSAGKWCNWCQEGEPKGTKKAQL